jgi:hypothetical protein
VRVAAHRRSITWSVPSAREPFISSTSSTSPAPGPWTSSARSARRCSSAGSRPRWKCGHAHGEAVVRSTAPPHNNERAHRPRAAEAMAIPTAVVRSRRSGGKARRVRRACAADRAGLDGGSRVHAEASGPNSSPEARWPHRGKKPSTCEAQHAGRWTRPAARRASTRARFRLEPRRSTNVKFARTACRLRTPVIGSPASMARQKRWNPCRGVARP